MKQQITDMAIHGSGMRDTARVLKISRNTVTEELKKSSIAASGKWNLPASRKPGSDEC